MSNLTIQSPAPRTDVRPLRRPPDPRLFRSIAELVDAGIWVTDLAGDTVFANGRLAGLLAIDAARPDYGRLWGLFDLDTQQRLAEAQPAEFSASVTRLDGRLLRLRVSATPWMVAGDHLGSIVICVEAPIDGSRRREEPLGWDTLSRREREVIEDIALGDRVPLIATRLYISQSTVRNHLSSAFRKLKVSDQQELVELLRRRDHKYMPEPAPDS